MVKFSAFFKDILREIWRTRARFLSILAIVALGCGFFSGMKASAPDMQQTASDYYEDTLLMDLRVVSTQGLTEADLEAVSQLRGIETMLPCWSFDALISFGEQQDVPARVLTLPNEDSGINTPVLTEGRWPRDDTECVADSHGNTTFTLGDTVTLSSGTGTDLSSALSRKTFTVVGKVESSLYIGISRGYTTLSDGQLDTFIMLPPQVFTLPVYTDLYLRVKEARGLPAYEEDYERVILEWTDALEQVARNRETDGYRITLAGYRGQLSDGWKQWYEGKAEADAAFAEPIAQLEQAEKDYAAGEAELETALAQAEARLAAARKTLDQGRAEYEAGIAEADAAEEEGRAALEEARAELEEGEAAYAEGRAAFDPVWNENHPKLVAADAALTTAEQTLAASRAAWNGAMDSLVWAENRLAEDPDNPEALADILEELADLTNSAILRSLARTLRENPEMASAFREAIEAGLAETRADLEQQDARLTAMETQTAQQRAEWQASRNALDAARAELDAGWQAYYDGVEELETRLAEGRETLAKARAELEAGEAAYAAGAAAYETRSAEGRAQLEEARLTLEENKAAFTAKYNETYDQLEEARLTLLDKQEQLAQLKAPVWYIFTREDNPNYSDFLEDSLRIDAIASVFPIFFVLVVSLVVLTTMTRMVDESRTLVGTYKALGYPPAVTASRFVIYAVSAGVIGCILGLFIGFSLFPTIIFGAYKVAYHLPKVVTPFHWNYALGSFAVSVASTGLVAWWACRRDLTGVTAALLRPRAPKSGKRILLERSPLWRKIGFLSKIAIRNISRYKGRMLISVLGVCGCCALLFAGFGLRVSVADVADLQYGGIYHFDAVCALNEPSARVVNNLEAALAETPDVEGVTFLSEQTMEVKGKATVSASIAAVRKPEELEPFISLRERATGDPLSLTDDGVIITEKLSRLIGRGAGDSLTLKDGSGAQVEAQILGVTEHYVLHYVYMTETLYRSLWETSPSYTVMYVNLEENYDREGVSRALLEQKPVLGCAFASDVSTVFHDLLGSLDMIVVVIIIAAGTLAIIVMFSLTNIAVNERKRELATIKVLGFYDREVSAYIYRENILSTVLGIAAGLGAGIFLNRFIISTAEVDMVMFSPRNDPLTFLYAAGLTLFFAVAVNLAFHWKIKRISMVESLKSAE